MTSLGKSCLKYMVALKPELERRGYEVAVFHTTGMGGRAFESIAAQRRLRRRASTSACRKSPTTYAGSSVSSGAGPAENAGQERRFRRSWRPARSTWSTSRPGRVCRRPCSNRPLHAHNRLLASFTVDGEGRRKVARAIGEKLAAAKGPVAFILPEGGIQEWDQPDEPLHDPEALAAFVAEMRAVLPDAVEQHAIGEHINSEAFVETALAIFDRWVAEGVVVKGSPA